MDAEDLAQVADSLRQAVTAGSAGARAAVTEFGWHELLVEEPEAAVGTLFALQGHELLDDSFLDDVLVAASGLDLPDDVRVVLPRLGGAGPTSRLEGADVRVDGVVRAGTGPLLVPCLDGDDVTLVTIGGVEVEPPGDVLDPASGWTAVSLTAAVDGDPSPDASEVWTAMLAAGRHALAHELTAVAGAMRDLTVEHVRTREQFGRPLGANQAVKHQLADVHLWHEVALLASSAAWEDLGPVSAALAKAAAVRASRSARVSCQQLLGGMGFTWEHDFHRYLRRALTLEPLLGGADAVHAELGAGLRAGVVPASLASL